MTKAIAKWSLTAAAKAAIATAVATALEELPGVSAVVTFVEKADKKQREERLRVWEAVLRGDESADDVAARIKAGLEGDERAVLRAAILGGARAAVDAIDDIVVPSIALLTRLHIETTSVYPPPHVFRALLTLLERMDAELFRGLNGAIDKVAEVNLGKDVSTNLNYDKETAEWSWYALAPNPEGGNLRPVVLLQGELAVRACAALVGEQRSVFQRDPFPPDGPKGLLGPGEAVKPVLTASRVELLRSFWYLP